MSHWSRLIDVKVIQIDITQRCNYKCYFCRNKKRIETDINKKNLLKFISQFPKKTEIILSGGEPFLYPDIYNLIESLHKRGHLIGITSNASLINEKIIKKIKNKIMDIQISILSPNEKKYEEIANVKGSFKKLINSIKLIKKYNIKIYARFTLTRLNINEIPDLLKFIKRFDLPLDIRMVIPKGRGYENWSSLKIDYETYIKILKKLFGNPKVRVTCGDPISVPFNKKLIRKLMEYGNIYNGEILAGCLAAKNILYIDPSGDIFPCAYLPMKLGKITDNFDDMLMNQNYKIFMNYKQELKGLCGKCEYKFICGGCRAVSYNLTGDVLNKDPRCKFN